MKKNTLKLLSFYFLTIIFFVIITEISLRIIFIASDSNLVKDDTLFMDIAHEKIENNLPSNIKDYFCDFIHKKPPVNIFVAEEVSSIISSKKDTNILIIGGSTSDKNECGKAKSWPKLLEEIGKYNVFNFAKEATNSDYGVEKVSAFYKKNIKGDVIIWAYWINEFLVNASKDDINFSKLKDRGIISPASQSLIKNLLRLELTLYKNLFSFRVPINFISQSFNQLQFNHFASTQHSENERSPFMHDKFKSVEDWFSYSLENTHINFEKIYNISRNHNAELIVLIPPYPKGYLRYINESYYQLIEKKWIKSIRIKLKDLSKQYGAIFLDLSEKSPNVFQNGQQNNSETK